MIATAFQVAFCEEFFSSTLQSLTESQLAVLDEPLNILPDPEPHTKLGQQVHRLEQHGLYKAARAVSVCGRIGEKWTYECGRSAVRKIIRSHRRFCCRRCDEYLAGRLFDEHRLYQLRLRPGTVLFRITIRSNYWPVSREGIRQFENTYVAAARDLFKAAQGWGFKAVTHSVDGHLLAEGIIAIAPGMSLPSSLSMANATCSLGIGQLAYAYDGMLSEILRPKLTEGNG